MSRERVISLGAFAPGLVSTAKRRRVERSALIFATLLLAGCGQYAPTWEREGTGWNVQAPGGMGSGVSAGSAPSTAAPSAGPAGGAGGVGGHGGHGGGHGGHK